MHEQDVGRVIYRALDMLNARAVREFRVPPSTYIGPGATVRAGEACAALGIRRLFVMVDGRLHEQALDQGLLRSLDDAGLGCECLVYAGGEPHSEVVEAAGRQLLAADCDGVLAFGGGSVLDAAKATALLKMGMDPRHVNAVAGWREAHRFFDERVRAALNWAEAVNAVPHCSPSDEDFAQVRAQFTDAEVAELTFVVGAIRAWNMLNASFHTLVPPQPYLAE